MTGKYYFTTLYKGRHVCISGTNLRFDWTVGEILTEQNQFFFHDYTDLTMQMLGNVSYES